MGSGPSPGLRLRPRGCGAPAPPASPSARRERQGLDGVAGPVAGKSRDGWHPARSGEGGGGWALLLAGRADFLPAWTPLPLSWRPGLESPTWLPQSPDTRRTVYTISARERGQVGVSGPFPEDQGPFDGSSPRLACWGLGRLRLNPPPELRQAVSLIPSSRLPPPATVAATAAPYPPKARGCGRGPGKSGGGGTAQPEQTEKVTIFLHGRLSPLSFIFLYSPSPFLVG